MLTLDQIEKDLEVNSPIKMIPRSVAIRFILNTYQITTKRLNDFDKIRDS